MMGVQFGNIKIGAMQYNGVTIGEAMMDGQIVYRSAVRYTASGSYTGYVGSSLPVSTWVVLASHTVPAGNYFGTLSATTVWYFAHSDSNHYTEILLNGVRVAYGRVQDVATGAGAVHTVTSDPDIEIPGGASIQVRGFTTQSSSLYRRMNSGSWSVT